MNAKERTTKMIWIAYIVGGLVGLVAVLMLVLWLLGSRAPVDHAASVSLRLKRTSPEQVWGLIVDPMSYNQWATGVKKVEKLPDRDGREAVRQWMGRISFVLETTRSEPPRLLERTITDDCSPFSGRWRYELTPEGAGCVVNLTEHGRVTQAIPRAVMKHLMGYHCYLRKHLRAIAAKFGEEAEIADRKVG